jgi:hypothetical protein
MTFPFPNSGSFRLRQGFTSCLGTYTLRFSYLYTTRGPLSGSPSQFQIIVPSSGCGDEYDLWVELVRDRWTTVTFEVEFLYEESSVGLDILYWKGSGGGPSDYEIWLDGITMSPS